MKSLVVKKDTLKKPTMTLKERKAAKKAKKAARDSSTPGRYAVGLTPAPVAAAPERRAVISDFGI